MSRDWTRVKDNHYRLDDTWEVKKAAGGTNLWVVLKNGYVVRDGSGLGEFYRDGQKAMEAAEKMRGA